MNGTGGHGNEGAPSSARPSRRQQTRRAHTSKAEAEHRTPQNAAAGSRPVTSALQMSCSTYQGRQVACHLTGTGETEGTFTERAPRLSEWKGPLVPSFYKWGN